MILLRAPKIDSIYLNRWWRLEDDEPNFEELFTDNPEVFEHVYYWMYDAREISKDSMEKFLQFPEITIPKLTYLLTATP